MMHKKTAALAGLVILLGVGTIAYANHSWGGYHWARTSNPFTLQLGDNVSSVWDSYLATTASDWATSTVLDTVVKPGKTKPRICKATTGRVEVCSEKYGFTGWLGVAQIWVSGSHITKGTVKVNDSYFNTSIYNTSAWRNLVMCQEVGHMLGLDHQDEAFDNPNLGTCMDYTNDPSTNQHPNQHDYDQLLAIYSHLDGVNTILTSGEGDGNGGGGKGRPAHVGQDIDANDPSAWGQAVKHDAEGKNSLYVRDLGNGEKVITFVIWTK